MLGRQEQGREVAATAMWPSAETLCRQPRAPRARACTAPTMSPRALARSRQAPAELRLVCS